MVDIGIYPNEEGSNEFKFMSSGSKGFSSLEEASDSIALSSTSRKPKDVSGLKEFKIEGRWKILLALGSQIHRI